MGIWDRLGTVIKSYLNDDSDNTQWRKGNGTSSGRGASSRRGGDPDLNSAWEELDDYLRDSDSAKPGESGRESGRDSGAKTESASQQAKRKRPIPEHIRKEFEELGLGPDASAEECKEAYKKLLKVHHPDHHTDNSENLKKATEKTARVNAAYDRLEEWFRGEV